MPAAGGASFATLFGGKTQPSLSSRPQSNSSDDSESTDTSEQMHTYSSSWKVRTPEWSSPAASKSSKWSSFVPAAVETEAPEYDADATEPTREPHVVKQSHAEPFSSLKRTAAAFSEPERKSKAAALAPVVPASPAQAPQPLAPVRTNARELSDGNSQTKALLPKPRDDGESDDVEAERKENCLACVLHGLYN
jgi:hypothetical protein